MAAIGEERIVGKRERFGAEFYVLPASSFTKKSRHESFFALILLLFI